MSLAAHIAYKSSRHEFRKSSNIFASPTYHNPIRRYNFLPSSSVWAYRSLLLFPEQTMLLLPLPEQVHMPPSCACLPTRLPTRLSTGPRPHVAGLGLVLLESVNQKSEGERRRPCLDYIQRNSDQVCDGGTQPSCSEQFGVFLQVQRFG